MQAMLLTSYLKLLVADPSNVQLKGAVEEVYDRYSRYVCCRHDLVCVSNAARICSLGSRRRLQAAAAQSPAA